MAAKQEIRSKRFSVAAAALPLISLVACFLVGAVFFELDADMLVLALLAAGYLMGVLSDPPVRRAFDLSRMLDLEAEGAPEPGRRL